MNVTFDYKDDDQVSIHSTPKELMKKWAEATGEEIKTIGEGGSRFDVLTFYIGTLEIKLFS